MSREVIQDFLSLAGVVGIALTNRRMRPYFYGLDSVQDRTKQALGQGVLQVVENLPEGFESFEFHFGSYIVFIYKLTHGLVLLVLTDKDLELVSYGRSIIKIKYLIETDTYNTVAYFKLLLGSVTQHSLPSKSWTDEQSIQKTVETPTTHSFNESRNKPNSELTSTSNLGANRTLPNNTLPNSILSNNTLSRTNSDSNLNKTPEKTPENLATNTQSRQSPKVEPTVNPNLNANTSPNINLSPSKPASPVNTAIASQTTPTNTKAVSAKAPPQDYKLDELLEALNKLSHFTTQYLGKVVVTNYWKSTRPDASWLKEFEVDRNGQISHPQQLTLRCKPEQVQQMREWVATYVKRCKQVIRNFDQMLTEDCLSAHQKQILF